MCRAYGGFSTSTDLGSDTKMGSIADQKNKEEHEDDDETEPKLLTQMQTIIGCYSLCSYMYSLSRYTLTFATARFEHPKSAKKFYVDWKIYN